eukprot:5294438-Alexandrium_andersonii.AAC.1
MGATRPQAIPAVESLHDGFRWVEHCLARVQHCSSRKNDNGEDEDMLKAPLLDLCCVACHGVFSMTMTWFGSVAGHVRGTASQSVSGVQTQGGGWGC